MNPVKPSVKPPLKPPLNPYVWTIAGSDSSGAAGLQADLKTMTSLNAHGASIVTALTAQNPREVLAVEAVSPSMLEKQFDALERYAPPAAVKIGMLGSAETVRAVAKRLKSVACPVVLDPVMVTSSGHRLADDETIDAMRNDLMPLATVVTPNIPEAALLTGHELAGTDGISLAAARLRELGADKVVIKGGHGDGESVRDYVATGDMSFWMSGPRLKGQVSGTGCTFASALAAKLASGTSFEDAAVCARAYVARGIRLSAPLQTGDVQSPLWHGPWPVEAVDMPMVSSTPHTGTIGPFPKVQPEDLGFYPIVDRAAEVRRLVRLGGLTIQLRIKDLTGDALEAEVEEACRLARDAQARLYVNDYVDLALKHGAYGVHLGQEDLDGIPAGTLGSLHAAGLRLGISTHSYFEACRAITLCPSYIALGPIRETTCKSMRFGPQGFERIKEWKRLFPYALVAIGGIGVKDAEAVFGAGAEGLSFISDLPAYVRLLESRLPRAPRDVD